VGAAGFAVLRRQARLKERHHKPFFDRGGFMKLFLVAMIATLSSLAMASGLEKGQAYVEEVYAQPIGQGEFSQQTKMMTNLKLTSVTAKTYVFQSTSQTVSYGDSVFHDISNVVLTEAGDQSRAVIYDVDGNSMGVNKTALNALCEKQTQVMICKASLANGDRLYLAVGL
jgi:hypothetical protein